MKECVNFCFEILLKTYISDALYMHDLFMEKINKNIRLK